MITIDSSLILLSYLHKARHVLLENHHKLSSWLYHHRQNNFYREAMFSLANHHNVMVPYPPNCLLKPHLKNSVTLDLYSLSGHRSREVSKSRYSGLDHYYSSETWQAPQQRRCRDACQMAERYDRHNRQSRKVPVRWVNRSPKLCSTRQWSWLVSKSIMLHI